MAHGLQNQTERRGGQRGNTRGRELQVRKRTNRLAQPRVQAALSEAQQVNATLAAQARDDMPLGPPQHEHSDVMFGDPPRYGCCWEPVPLPRLAELQANDQIVVPAPRRVRPTPLPIEGEGNGQWTMGQARSLIRAGYSLAHVVKLTGFGTKWLDDMALDSDGYGLPL